MKRGNTKIAIRGNSKNGTKIIEYLKSIGGNNSYMSCDGEDDDMYYYIDSDRDINWEDDLDGLKDEGYTIIDTIPNINKIYELWV